MPVDSFSHADNKDYEADHSTYCHVEVAIERLAPEMKYVDWNNRPVDQNADTSIIQPVQNGICFQAKAFE